MAHSPSAELNISSTAVLIIVISQGKCHSPGDEPQLSTLCCQSSEPGFPLISKKGVCHLTLEGYSYDQIRSANTGSVHKVWCAWSIYDALSRTQLVLSQDPAPSWSLRPGSYGLAGGAGFL